jgi:hypothetical protein
MKVYTITEDNLKKFFDQLLTNIEENDYLQAGIDGRLGIAINHEKAIPTGIPVFAKFAEVKEVEG